MDKVGKSPEKFLMYCRLTTLPPVVHRLFYPHTENPSAVWKKNTLNVENRNITTDRQGICTSNSGDHVRVLLDDKTQALVIVTNKCDTPRIYIGTNTFGQTCTWNRRHIIGKDNQILGLISDIFIYQELSKTLLSRPASIMPYLEAERNQ